MGMGLNIYLSHTILYGEKKHNLPAVQTMWQFTIKSNMTSTQ